MRTPLSGAYTCDVAREEPAEMFVRASVQRSISCAALWAGLALAGCASGYRPPQFVGGADLIYPATAVAAGVEGRVVIRYDVTEEGRVANATVQQAEPPGVFEAAALAAVRSWRFKPAARGREVVAARNRVSEVTFRVSDDGKYDHLPGPRQER